MSCGGSHLGITINIKNTKFVKDLPMIDHSLGSISAIASEKKIHSFYIGPIGFFYNQVNDTGS
jgi:hypothetical protein